MGSFLEGVDQQTEVFGLVFIILAAYMYIKCDKCCPPPPPYLRDRVQVCGGGGGGGVRCVCLRARVFACNAFADSYTRIGELLKMPNILRGVSSYQSANIRAQASNFPTGVKGD